MWGNQKKTRIEKIYDYLKWNSSYAYKKDAMTFIKNNVLDGQMFIYSEDTLADILITIINNEWRFDKAIKTVNTLYNVIGINKNNDDENELFLKLFTQYMSSEGVIDTIDYYSYVYSTFENKKLILELYNILNVKKMSSENISMIIYYMSQARKYYVDETAFFASIVNLIDKFYTSVKLDKSELVNKELETAKKVAGVYDIDEKYLDNLPFIISDVANRQHDLEDKQFELDNKLKEAEAYIEQVFKSIDSCKKENEIIEAYNRKDLEEIKEMTHEVKDIIDNFKSDVNNGVSSESSSKLDTLIDQLVSLNNKLIVSNLDTSKSSNNESIEDKSLISTKNESESNEIMDLYLNNLIGKIKKDIDEYCHFEFELYDATEVDNKFKKYLIDSFNCNSVDSVDQLAIHSPTYNFLLRYYWALYNSTLEIFKVVMTKYDVKDLNIIIFSKDVVSQFDEKEYINMLFNNMDLLVPFAKSNEIHTLKEILSINPNFEFIKGYSSFLELSEIFNIEEIALNKENFRKSVESLHSGYSFEMNLLKKFRDLYRINPDFKLSSRAVLRIPDFIFSRDEKAHFNDQQQEWINSLIYDGEYYRAEYGDYSEFTDEEIKIVRDLVLNCSDAYISREVISIIKDKKFNINTEQYLQLSYEESKKLMDLYTIYYKTDILAFKQKNKVLKLAKQTLKEVIDSSTPIKETR